MAGPNGASLGRRLAAPAVPCVLSLILSLSTVGSHVFWQDSGFYLAAVKEMSALYPPGFAVYQILCKIWTLILSFVEFTLAVHLFSSVCAAAAAGAVALATRELLKARVSVFKVLEDPPGPQADVCAAAVGCLAAAGYTFWFSGIYAKGYSFLYLVLALLLWRMIRAAESRNPRDFTVVAILIGLAWQAHPSAALIGGALVLWVGAHRTAIGWKGVAWRSGVAAAVALGPVLLLPGITRLSPASFGNPDSSSEILDYMLGSRFTGRAGVFGWEPSRAASVGRFLWEEMLGVGLILVAGGAIHVALRNRRLFLGLLAWTVPVILVTVLFKIEGQHDFWFVSAWLPLYVTAGAGLYAMTRRAGRWAGWAAAGIAAGGVTWGAAANASDLYLKDFDLPERFGRLYLDALDPEALILVTSDDASAVTLYLTLVRGVREDVTVVQTLRLGDERTAEAGWYEQTLVKHDPRVKLPSYAALAKRFPDRSHTEVAAAALAGENARAGRSVYLETAFPEAMLPPGHRLSPAGTLWKVVRGDPTRLDEKYWNFPVTEEEILKRMGRARGQRVEISGDRIRVSPERYEARLLGALLRARSVRADGLKRRGDVRSAAKEYSEMFRWHPRAREDAGTAFRFGECLLAADNHAGAAEAFSMALARGEQLDPARRALTHAYLGEILRNSGRPEEAATAFRNALAVPGIPESVRREIERRARRE